MQLRIISVRVLVAVIIAISSRSAVGIIPGRCVNGSSINTYCCPDPNINDAGPCGSSLTSPRGQCVEVSAINPRCAQNASEMDPRKNWPHFFTHLCKCEGNYAGYDCGECKFGYRGDDCSEQTTTRRRSISTFSIEEREEYLNATIMAKREPYTRYLAISNDSNSEVVSVSLYDLFAWLHYYAGRDNDAVGNGMDPTARDFAHESGGFPTWHRLYLLWYERELKIQTGNEDFALPYWDWTKKDDREIALSDEWFGGIGADGEVTGDYFGGTDWPVVCSNYAKYMPNLCDPSTDRSGQLRRCPSPEECMKINPRWPIQEDVNRVVAIEAYDTDPYSRNSTSSFRNLLEGFDPNGCDDTTDLLCNKENRRTLHNAVHIILGIGDFGKTPDDLIGTMGDVPIASNDPIFSSHHAMIDYIFEQWLSRNPGRPYEPLNNVDAAESDSKYQGHREDDCLVPFLPLYTNADMYKPAREFGYEYVPDSRVEPSTNPTVATTDSAIPARPTGTLVLSLVVVTFCAFIVAA